MASKWGSLNVWWMNAYVLLEGKGSRCKMPLGAFQRGSGVDERQMGVNKVRDVQMCKELNKEGERWRQCVLRCGLGVQGGQM